MLGGGTFLTQNKILPGSYLNFVSAAKASAALSDRGIAAMAMELDWGPDSQVFAVDVKTFQDNAQSIFGYRSTHPKMKGLRDLFRNARLLYAYKLNNGVKAKNVYAEAKYAGIRGNDISIIVQANADDVSKWDVATALDGEILETQTAANASQLKPNAYVAFLPGANLAATAGTKLTGGSNGAAIIGDSYQSFLDQLEAYSFHTLGCLSDESTVKNLFTAFTKRMRDEMGVKFQTVLYQSAADYEGVINLDTSAQEDATGLIYWATGAQAGCPVNISNTNKTYDGEYTPVLPYTQAQLESGIKNGLLMLHKVGDEIHVLQDVNSLVSLTESKGADFRDNQTIRVLDQVANDVALLFNGKYLGKIPNDASGRMSLWNDIVAHHRELESIRAIENFKAEDVTVEAGTDKKSIAVSDAITIVNAMAQLYMIIVVQ